MIATFVTPKGHTAIERRKGERRIAQVPYTRLAEGGCYMHFTRSAIDRRRAAQHYGDQARIAKLEAALNKIASWDEGEKSLRHLTSQQAP